jgi:hypothetical protein
VLPPNLRQKIGYVKKNQKLKPCMSGVLKLLRLLLLRHKLTARSRSLPRAAENAEKSVFLLFAEMAKSKKQLALRGILMSNGDLAT